MRLVFLLAIFLVSNVCASEISRTVLAIWDSRGVSGSDYVDTNIHRKLEFVFNHYGLQLRYHDISKGTPDQSITKDILGVVSWFSSEGMRQPEAYARWLKSQMKARKKVLILGQAGFVQDEAGRAIRLELVNETLKSLGIEFSDRFFDNPLLFSIAHNQGKNFTEFERSLRHEIFSFRQVTNINPENEVWLKLAVKGEVNGSDVIIIGKNGGYAQNGFEMFRHPQENKTNWRVNPFKVVEKIFVDQNHPIPDTTTLTGKRIFFSHIDGDGLLNISKFKRDLTSGEVIYQEILKKYPLPVTVSVITLDADPKMGLRGSQKGEELARKMFSLPNVAIGSHTYSHPLSWSKQPSKLEIESYLGKQSKHQGPILSYKLKGLILDYDAETTGSIHFINQNLAPTGKKADILLWSGSCRPPEDALKSLKKNNYYNINGGDSRMDAIFDSHSHLSSLYRTVGEFTQIYSGNANENIYTDLWSPPFSGYKDVIQTFERTEEPQRLKPVNIYYHFYSGEHLASLRSLKQVYDWSMKQDLIPITAKDYASVVLGFKSLQMKKVSDGNYLITNNGALRTLKMLDPSLVPDYKKSRNIVGHQVFQGQLYIHLGPMETTHLVLTKKPVSSSYLISSNAHVLSVSPGTEGTTYHLKGEMPIRAAFMERGRIRKIELTSHETQIKVLN